MTTLTQIAITTRKIIRYSIYGLILIAFLRIAFIGGQKLYRKAFPKPPPPPNYEFGPLPKPYFPPKKDLPSFEFTIETAEGDLPVFPTQAKVYYIPSKLPKLLTLDATKTKVGALGFRTNPERVSQTVYKFKHPSVPSVLEINIVSGLFSISQDVTDNSALTNNRPGNPEAIISSVKNYLAGGEFLPEDLSGRTSYELLRIEGQRLVRAISLSETNLIKVNLFRKDLDKIPAMTPDPNQANVWFILSGTPESGAKVIAGEYHHLSVDEDKYATYPIKTAQQALEELRAGKGYIANLGLNEDGKVTIRKIYLGYYDSGSLDDRFLEPIIVFQGDDDFYAYVLAIPEENYKLEE